MSFSDLQRRLKRDSGTTKGKRRPTKGKPAQQLSVEALEGRLVPTVLFNPRFGLETLAPTPNNNFNYYTMSSAQVQLIFWGTFWGTQLGNSQAAAYAGKAQRIVESSYVSRVSQYGGTGIAHYLGYTIDSKSDPAAGYSAANSKVSLPALQTEIASAIDNLNAPAPNQFATQANAILYMVIVDQNHSDTTGGYNQASTYTYPNGPTVPINVVSVGLKGGSQDAFCGTVSHELVERMSDPTADAYGVSVNPPPGLPANVGSGLSQIGDLEPAAAGLIHYYYRMEGQTGFAVQPYWSNQDAAFVVPDGNQQFLFLTPNWTVDGAGNGTFSGTYSLAIYGDQLANAFGDHLTIDCRGVQTKITLNGEMFYFDEFDRGISGAAPLLTGITVNLQAGNDTINIEGAFAGTPIQVNLGIGRDTVNICPATQNLDNIQGNISVNTGSGVDTLNVNDQGNPDGHPYTITLGSITRTNAGTISWGAMNAVNINGAKGSPSVYNVFNTEPRFTTTLNTHSRGDVINLFKSFGTTNLNTAAGTTINVGNAGNDAQTGVQGIFGSVNIVNTSIDLDSDVLKIDDSTDGGGHTVTVTNSSISGLARGVINYDTGSLGGLNITGGKGGSTWNIQSTAAPIFLGLARFTTTTNVTGSGLDTILVGDHNGMQDIEGDLNFENEIGLNRITFDDSENIFPRNAVMDTFTPPGENDVYGRIAHLAPANVTYELKDTALPVTTYLGSGGNIVNISALGAPGMDLASGNNDSINVGNAVNGLQDIVGDLRLINPGSLAALSLDDSANMNAQFATIGSAGISGLATGSIFTSVESARSIIIAGGSGDSSFRLQSIDVAVPVMIHGGSGTNTLIGPDADPYWNITSPGAGTVETDSFTGMTNLVGGSAVDSFRFSVGGSIGSIDGGGGGDWLDYSLFTTGVTANLATGSATAVVGAISNIQNVLGGADSDSLTGGDLGSILVGGGGSNVLSAGNGRSLLIGGTGKATITGGAEDDILVGGTTSFDQDETALASILAEWQRTDKAYADRTQDLRYGGGYNGANKLDYLVTVQNTSGAHDILTGGAGLDWYFQFPGDTITDLNKGGTEQVENKRLPTGNVGYAHAYGSSGGFAQGQRITTDAAGNLYVVGAFQGAIDLDPGASDSTLTSKGNVDTYLAKYSAQGQLLWLQQWYGSDPNNDAVSGDYLKVDAAGNVYVTGYFFGSATIGSFSFTQSTSVRDDNHYDGFIAKLDTNGTVQWADQVATTQAVELNDLAIGASGNVFVSGDFLGSAMLGTIPLTSAGDYDGLVAKLNADGAFVWARSLGSSGFDVASGMSLDSASNLYIAGYFSETAHFGSLSLTSAGGWDGFVARLNGNGAFVWVRQLGGNLNDYVYNIQVDAGHVYATGGLNDPTTTGYGPDFYLAAYTTSGNLQWTDQFHDTGLSAGGASVAVDSTGGVYLNAFYSGTVNFGSTTVSSAGQHNVAVVKFTSAGAVTWVRQLSCSGDAIAYDLAVDPSFNIYTTGYFTDQADFDPGPDTDTITSHNNPDSLGTYDAFLWQLTQAGPMSYTTPPGSGAASYDLRLHEGYVQLVDTMSDTVLLSKAQVDITAVVIKAANGVNTTLAIDFSGGAYSLPVSFIGGTGTNTLKGPNVWNNWSITGANAGKLGKVGFTNVANLVGGSNVDVFKFTAAGSLSGNLDGGGAPLYQGDWLDYSSLTKAVTVDLQTGSASGVAGTVTNIQNVHGGNGGNTLTGNALGNVLIGGAGADTITGGSGLSLLIGDKGGDNLFGGSGGDILIGDSTTYDTMSTANQKALMAILAEWQSGHSYDTRFHDINTGTGGGLNGTAKLKYASTVKDDSAADTVTAAASSLALDWFFQGLGDTLANVEPGEHINNT
jgi:hypothetical protein